eukprot:CAMPEP_0182925450 /NCGR_PEP_ID=MMETSP0105_2-20130417/9418_1 /TAXON_ID=81532 ORGANISM="Acanthoeca-like sp., Strain 10tr" /NCGR_SAMPLE_ID=MMETSP0105_2 /ASSEMBLY_ACC=CAM_ASM_000205 /LENGTH=404 /DNA_ID=CAMNT_0025063299 /DNA_START=29 /DNA_END=1239 /DNA_ORIENTATION=-
MAVALYLQQKVAATQEAAPDIATIWNDLDSQYSRRLWHQLTLTLLKFVHNDCFAKGGLVELYENVIRDIEDRINPLSLVTLVNVVKDEIEDFGAALAFIEPLGPKIAYDTAASISLKTTVAYLNTHLGNLGDAKKVLDECETQLDDLLGVTPVHANYYRVAAELHKIEGRFADFYRTALRYLGCIELTDLQESEAVELAHDLCLAALLGEGIYNMGELLSHGIISFLTESSKEWLVELVKVFNSGDVAKFTEMKKIFPQESRDLEMADELLVEKVQLLAIMEAVFQRQAKERAITFSELAAATQVPEDQVEVLVMRALSLGLVKGSLDQIEATATFTWVQPRVLDLKQLGDMHARLGVWLEHVDQTSELLTTSAPELFASAVSPAGRALIEKPGWKREKGEDRE